MAGLISINGIITPKEEAKISPLDRGFLFGDNIFEVFVAFGTKIIDLKAHLKRLRTSAKMIALDIPFSDESLTFELESMVEATNFKKSYIRLVITRGEGVGLALPKENKPNKLIYCFPASPCEGEIYQEGITLKQESMLHRQKGSHPKTGNYLTSITALGKAQKEGFNDILWVNAEGELTEATTANIFLIGRMGDLVEIATPEEQSGLLLGITRSRIIELLERSQIPVTIRKIDTKEIPAFDEAFLCSTVKGLIPIKKIDGHRMHTKRTNSVFNHIERLYHSWIESQLSFRVDWNSGEPIS